MPTNQERLATLEERVRNNVWIFRIVAAGMIAWLAWISIQIYQINGHVSNLEGLEGKVTKIELGDQASVSQDIFEKSLPDLRATIATAHKQNVKVSQGTVDILQDKLLHTGSNAPDYWPTAAEFINYRSTVVLPEQAAKLLAGKIPDCTDSLPAPGSVASVESPTQATLNPAIYTNCRFKIDAADQDRYVNAILQGSQPFLKFTNCLIEYSGGPINLIVDWNKVPITLVLVGKTPEEPSETKHVLVTGHAIQFEDCVFHLAIQNTPPPEGQRLATTLLAQNATNVALPLQR